MRFSLRGTATLVACAGFLAATPTESHAQSLGQTSAPAVFLAPADYAAQAAAQKSTGTAALFSFLLPGAGQMYNEEIGKGVVMMVLTTVSVAMMIDGLDEYGCDATETCWSWLLPVGAGVNVAVHVWSIFDAAAGARRWNARHAGPMKVGSVERLPRGRVGVTLLATAF